MQTCLDIALASPQSLDDSYRCSLAAFFYCYRELSVLCKIAMGVGAIIYNVQASRSTSAIQGGRSTAAEVVRTKRHKGPVRPVVALSKLGRAL